MKRKRRKLRKKRIRNCIIGFILLIGVIFGGVSYFQYTHSNSYLLKELGYQKDEIEVILKQDPKEIDAVLKKEYQENMVSLLQEQYFILDNLDRYLSYSKKNPDKSMKDVVTLVNVNRDKEFYENSKKTDTSKKELMLVNKYYALGKEYQPTDIVPISNQYCYGENEIKEEVFDAFLEMWNAAKEEDLTLIITSSYRDYETQEILWNRYKDQQGQEWADSISARAGSSEHQTGYTLDIVTYNSVLNDFENTDEFKWLQKHAHEYGFIMRYPKGKEDITGYDYESWHYRYVGRDVATKIHELGITFDEYYAYYIENK